MKRPLLTLGLCSLLFIVGCDEPVGPIASGTTSRPATQAAGATEPTAGVVPADRASELAAQPRKLVQLIALPMTAEVPESWALQQEVGSRIVLRGNTPSGEVDILLSQWPPVKAEVLELILKKVQDSSSQSVIQFQTYEQAGLRVIEEIETLGAAGEASENAPMRWTIKFYRSGGALEWSVYELNILGLTKGSLAVDKAFLERIVHSVRFDEKANQATVP